MGQRDREWTMIKARFPVAFQFNDFIKFTVYASLDTV